MQALLLNIAMGVCRNVSGGRVQKFNNIHAHVAGERERDAQRRVGERERPTEESVGERETHKERKRRKR